MKRAGASDGSTRRGRGRRLLGLAVAVLVVAVLVAAVGTAGEVRETLAQVRWEWAALSVAANVASLVVRGFSWRVLLASTLRGDDAGTLVAQRAYLVGQLVNAVLPGRLGEGSKIAVYVGHLERPGRDWAAVLGAVAAHRLLDTVPLAILIAALVFTVGIPGWTIAVSAASAVLLLGGVALARRRHPEELAVEGRLSALLSGVRTGLGALRAPLTASVALVLQSVGWLIEVAGVWLAFRAIGLDGGLEAGLVVVATNAITLVPFVPSNVGLFQVVVAGVLAPVGVPYGIGLGFGIVLQAIETLSVLVTAIPAALYEGVTVASISQLRRGRPADDAPINEDARGRASPTLSPPMSVARARCEVE